MIDMSQVPESLTMSPVPQTRYYSLEEYLTGEELAEDKHEFYRGEIFLMAGGSPGHNRIAGNIFGQLYLQLRGKPCQPYNSDQRIAVKKYPLHTYPDISVICGKLVLDTLDKQAATNPHTLIEVLSPSTESYNRGLKFEFYRSLPSLQEYILVAQDRPAVDRFVRQPSGQWLLFDYHGLDATVPLVEIGCQLRLADIYEGVEFGEEYVASPPE